MRNETDADDDGEPTLCLRGAKHSSAVVCEADAQTSIYLGGSIDNATDDGRGWRNDLQNDSSYAAANIEFLNPLDLHDPQEYDFERGDVVSDDLSLLDEADGILLKYEHGRRCWGTPSEQGYALAVNRLTDDLLPVSVWWDEMNDPRGMGDVGYDGIMDEERLSLDDASPWLHDPKCAIGVYEDQTTALTSLLSSTGHGADNPYPCETEDSGDCSCGSANNSPKSCSCQTATRDYSSDEMAVLFEGAPLEEVLEVFADHGLGTAINRESFDDIRGCDNTDVGNVIRFLDTLGVLQHHSGYTVVLEDSHRSQELLAQFVESYDSGIIDEYAEAAAGRVGGLLD